MKLSARDLLVKWGFFTWGLALVLVEAALFAHKSYSAFGASAAYFALAYVFMTVFEAHSQPRTLIISIIFSTAWIAMILIGIFDWVTTTALGSLLGALWNAMGMQARKSGED